MKLIPNPTPNFDSFKEECRCRFLMMGYSLPPDKHLKKEWVSRKNASFFSDKIFECIRRDDVKDMPHSDNKIFTELAKNTLIWLAIRKYDGLLPTWDDKQYIKNSVVGESHEAVELYPNELRNAPVGIQDHIWCLKQPNTFHPFGFGEMEMKQSDNSS